MGHLVIHMNAMTRARVSLYKSELPLEMHESTFYIFECQIMSECSGHSIAKDANEEAWLYEKGVGN